MPNKKYDRISARLDPQTAKRLERLLQETGLGVTDLICSAITEYFDLHIKGERDKKESLRENNFIGCVDGPKDLSSSYKEVLTRSLSQKHSS